ncbi:uncharacterized protein LOC110996270 [Pieris rapae]|uniref:uncharacterized protein LOC110996270 n=1 Tax=Pieris rapae TaxID=64459 RepID=UPI000B9299E2|nr:uncharacterized protein LOC110996270 [Pieris rapae]
MANSNSSAVFFLGTRAHYQVLDPETYDSGNTSTETLCQNDELWKDQDNESPSCNQTGLCYGSDINVNFDTGVKKRLNRHVNESVPDIEPALLNGSQESELEKDKPRRKFLSFLTSLTRRKRRSNVQYLQHLENVLTTCTFRESCRCLDCQSRYFDYDSEPEDVSEEDYAYSYSVQDQSQVMADDDSEDEVFLAYNGDNTSTDLLIDDPETITSVSSSSEEPEEKQTQLEVAASTSAVLNVLLFHPACIVQ